MQLAHPGFEQLSGGGAGQGVHHHDGLRDLVLGEPPGQRGQHLVRVEVGARIRLVARLAEVEEVPGGVQVTVDGAIETEGGAKPAAVLQSVSRFYA